MRFVDEVSFDIKAGDGGNGSAALRRERHKPRGGPCGGDGGGGGSVVFVADRNVGTLLDLKSRPLIKARRGEDGKSNDCHGAGADNICIKVPVGTVVYDHITGGLIGDLTKDEQELVAAKGGFGGRGNMHFATSSNRAPRRSEPGTPGEEKTVRLELKLLADVGLLGLPNVGKSTLITRLSSAKPKVADYPFTTLVPNLGVVKMGQGSSFVMADIPGIIRGAADGAGLGIRFLRHVQRSAILLHIIAPDEIGNENLLTDFDDLSAEVKAFDEKLAARPRLVALNKSDLTGVDEEVPALKEALKERGFELVVISAATGTGLEPLKYKLFEMLQERPVEEESEEEELEEEELEKEEL